MRGEGRLLRTADEVIDLRRSLADRGTGHLRPNGLSFRDVAGPSAPSRACKGPETASGLNSSRGAGGPDGCYHPAMGSDLVIVLVIVLIAVVIWRGPKTLPLLGKAFGQGVREARKEIEDMKSDAEGDDAEGDDAESKDGGGTS